MTTFPRRIPRDPAFDSTLAVLREGYDFIWNRCRRFDSELFVARVMGKKTVCIHGREAAAIFYDATKMQRGGAIPRRVQASLFGKRAIQTLDGTEHRTRKAAMLSLMSPASLERLMDRTAHDWRQAVRRWQLARSIVLFDEVARVLTRAVCAWAEVPLAESDVAMRARDFLHMVDAFGGVGPRLWKGKLARARTESWLAGVVTQVRGGALAASPRSALHAMATLPSTSATMAARELINLLRPTVAITWYVSFAALALHEHPEARVRLMDRDPAYRDAFMQEVRRFYPFTPYLGAKVKAAFDWKGLRFEPGTLVLLDVHGTNHDPRYWSEPDTFRPERFLGLEPGPYDFIPQGGGDPARGHRCPGEWLTMHEVTLALHFLTRCMTYEFAPGQDLGFDLARMPTRPRSGLVRVDVRSTEALDRDAPRLPSRLAAEANVAAVASGSVTPLETGPVTPRFVPRAHVPSPHQQ